LLNQHLLIAGRHYNCDTTASSHAHVAADSVLQLGAPRISHLWTAEALQFATLHLPSNVTNHPSDGPNH
jgi:hypothetical protein